ncbi:MULTISPECIES: hypothetical protein [unclassified Pseudonocardia]|uniref:hypothetical protein n=1 Tax=unclassified Pseudonocardia TaxID=2619320 RepID=UPI000A79ED40|nr:MULTISPECIES: hypothetical protein [unclassified Pseudonocardia]
MRRDDPGGAGQVDEAGYAGFLRQSAEFVSHASAGGAQRTARQVLGAWERWCRREGSDPLVLDPTAIRAFLATAPVGHTYRDRERAETVLEQFRSTVADDTAAQPSASSGASAVLLSPASAAAPDGALEPTALIWLLDTAEVIDAPILGLSLLVAVNGLGVGEALGLDVEHVASTDGLPVVRLPRRWGRRSVVPLAAATAAALTQCTAGRSEGPLLRAVDAGERLSSVEAAQRFTAVAAAVGLDRQVTPAALEQTFVSLALSADVPISALTHALGDVDGRADHSRHAAFAICNYLASQDPLRFV